MVCPEDRAEMSGSWTDSETKGGGTSTELSDRINHATSSSSFSVSLFGLCRHRGFIYSGTSLVSQVDSKSKGDIVYHIVLKTGCFA